MLRGYNVFSRLLFQPLSAKSTKIRRGFQPYTPKKGTRDHDHSIARARRARDEHEHDVAKQSRAHKHSAALELHSTQHSNACCCCCTVLRIARAALERTSMSRFPSLLHQQKKRDHDHSIARTRRDQAITSILTLSSGGSTQQYSSKHSARTTLVRLL